MSSRSSKFLILLRCTVYALAIVLMNALLPLGTSIVALIVASCAGLMVGIRLGQTKITNIGMLVIFLCILACTIFAMSGGLSIFGYLVDPLWLYGLTLHGELVVAFFLLALLFSYYTVRSPSVFLVESALMLIISVAALAAHRNLQLDSPLIINDLSWWFGVNPITTLAALGCAGAFLSIVYGFISAFYFQAIKPHQSNLSFSAKKQFVMLLVLFLLVSTATFYGITAFYKQKGEGFLSNGVGQSSEEGLSPLSFQSALGSTNQPSALVRLESDYSENPSTPMLYMRESALSVFNGRELVLAPPGLDEDVSHGAPDFPFAPEKTRSKEGRVEIKQVMYLLTPHKLPFAIDFPESIKPIKNPNPSKFKGGSYQALSYAPTFTYASLADAPVGDPSWDAKTRSTYLATQGDPRYFDLAKSITKDAITPMQKIQSVVSFLAAHTIYTLTPGREVSATEDPVAPFLFGDGRGYCVHIAHATVLLLRALGIPSRIGTGYLTDLSQAKDGHILLRMSDRHAWAEVYITNMGWIPFDTQPLRVESHADSEVDQKLLEELMGLVDPSEELLPPETNDEPESTREQIERFLPYAKKIIPAVLLVSLLAIIITKLFLFFGWKLSNDATTRLRRKHRAHLAWIYDAGFGRNRGETKREYQSRIKNLLFDDFVPLTDSIVNLQYSGVDKNIDMQLLNEQMIKGKKSVPLSTQLKASLNPRSVFRYWGGRLW